MVAQPDILIIGSGLIGLSTADQLAERGANVTIVEARSGAGKGTSYANSGMIHPSQARPWDYTGEKYLQDAAFEATYDLAVKSKHLLEDKLKTFNLWTQDNWRDLTRFTRHWMRLAPPKAGIRKMELCPAS